MRSQSGMVRTRKESTTVLSSGLAPGQGPPLQIFANSAERIEIDPIGDHFWQMARLFEEKTPARLSRRRYPNLTVVLSKAGSERYDPVFAARRLGDAFSECTLDIALCLQMPAFAEIDDECQSALCPLNRSAEVFAGRRTFRTRRAPGCDLRHGSLVIEITASGCLYCGRSKPRVAEAPAGLKTGGFLSSIDSCSHISASLIRDKGSVKAPGGHF